MRIHFDKKLPSIEEIEKQFKKQTGLNIWIKADVNLLELPLNNRDVIKILNQDIDKYENFRNERKKSKKINHIIQFQFYNPRFYEISFLTEGTTIIMSYGMGYHYYFPSSLGKAFYDLGGKFEGFDQKIKRNWSPPKHWKKLKRWEEYKWYNRPSSRKYCKLTHKRILNKISRMVLEAEYYIKEKLNIKQ